MIQPAAISRSAFRAVIRFVASITNVERSEAVCNDKRGHTEHDRGERPCADLEAELLRITRAAASITPPRSGFGCTRGGEMAEAALLERRSAPDRGVGTRASNSPAVPANVPIATWPTSSFAGTVRYSSFAVRDHELERRGIVLALARVEQDLREQLERTGLVTHIGQDRLFATLPVALDAFLPPLAVRTPAISESRLYI